MKHNWDVIIVGSGFGGSVSALRLAEKGYKVLVIEKGKRYRTEDDRVPVESSQNAFKKLLAQGANAELLLYKGKHKIGVEFIRKLKEKIQSK